jgi:hypothetical protein
MDAGFFLFSVTKMADAPDRQEIARQYGFQSFSELLDVSDRLPRMPVDGQTQAYMAWHPKGYWFVWEEPIIGDATENA